MHKSFKWYSQRIIYVADLTCSTMMTCLVAHFLHSPMADTVCGDDGWTTCIDPRKEKRRQKCVQRRQCQHLIRYAEAHRLEKEQNIRGLAAALLSKTTRDKQFNGWAFSGVIRPEDDPSELPEEDTWTIENFNRYGDSILFVRLRAEEEASCHTGHD